MPWTTHHKHTTITHLGLPCTWGCQVMCLPPTLYTKYTSTGPLCLPKKGTPLFNMKVWDGSNASGWEVPPWDGTNWYSVKGPISHYGRVGGASGRCGVAETIIKQVKLCYGVGDVVNSPRLMVT